jgi:hypothetical protein
MVNAVIPGAWRTRMDDAMYDYLRRTGKPFLASEEEIRENPGRDLRDPANATPPNPDAERHVSAVVGWLASEQCDFGGVILHAGLGRVARVFFAQGRGYSAPDITLDGLVAHREEVLTEADYEVPRSSSDSLASFRG